MVKIIFPFIVEYLNSPAKHNVHAKNIFRIYFKVKIQITRRNFAPKVVQRSKFLKTI